MAISEYKRERKRIYEEAEGRGRGFRKRALAKLDREFGVRHIKAAGRSVGVRFESGEVGCRKQRFESEGLAQDAIGQIHRFRDTGHVKPHRAYQCLHCGYWHLTHWTKPPAHLVEDDDS